MSVTADHPLDPVVHAVLMRARRLLHDARTLDDAVEALEALTRELEPPSGCARGADEVAAQPVRTILSMHLRAVHAVREAEASDASVARLVRQAVNRVERAVLDAGAHAG